MKKIHALVMSLIMLFIVLAPAQNVEAAGKSLKVSEKAFFKEMKEFDYKGMNRYVIGEKVDSLCRHFTWFRVVKSILLNVPVR